MVPVWGYSHLFPSAGIAGMRAKPTCIYSNPTIRGIPFKCKIYWPTNSLPGSVASQPKCCLNYSENTVYVEGGGAHSQLCASSSCSGIAFPSSEIPWNVCFDQYLQVLYNYRYKCTKRLFLGESLKFKNIFFHSKWEKKGKLRKLFEEKKILKFKSRTEEVLNYLDIHYSMWFLINVQLGSLHPFPRINILALKLPLEPRQGQLWEVLVPACAHSWMGSCSRSGHCCARLGCLGHCWLLGVCVTITVPLVCHSTGDKPNSALPQELAQCSSLPYLSS